MRKLNRNKRGRDPESTVPSPKNNKSTIEVQLGDNKEDIKSTEKSTKRVQVGSNKSSKRVHLEDLKSTQRRTEKSTIGVQNSKDIPVELLVSGQNKKLLKLLFLSCKNSGSLVSEIFTLDQLSTLLNVKKSVVKTIVRRVVEKGLIERHAGKRGRGGWIQFKIKKEVYDSLVNSEKKESDFFNNLNDVIWSTEKSTEKSTNPSSSSSSNYFKEETTITRPKILDEIDIQWDIETLGLHEGQINQLITLLNQGRVTESLFRLTLSEVAFHKENGGEFKKNPISALFHGLRTGHGFKSTIREEIEEKRKAEVEKQLIEKQKAEEARIEAEYQPWRDSLSDEEKTEILKRFNALDRTEQIQEVMLRNHFKRSI